MSLVLLSPWLLSSKLRPSVCDEDNEYREEWKVHVCMCERERESVADVLFSKTSQKAHRLQRTSRPHGNENETTDKKKRGERRESGEEMEVEDVRGPLEYLSFTEESDVAFPSELMCRHAGWVSFARFCQSHFSSSFSTSPSLLTYPTFSSDIRLVTLSMVKDHQLAKDRAFGLFFRKREKEEEEEEKECTKDGARELFGAYFDAHVRR